MNRTYAAVFFSVFVAGFAMLFALKNAENAGAKNNDPQRTIRENSAFICSPRERPVPFGYPLKLPMSAHNVSYPTDGWECSGELDANFVSAFGQISSCFQNQGWKPEKRISLDANLSPRAIFTFGKPECGLVLMLWKIDTDTTGFSYRRESKKLQNEQ